MEGRHLVEHDRDQTVTVVVVAAVAAGLEVEPPIEAERSQLHPSIGFDVPAEHRLQNRRIAGQPP